MVIVKRADEIVDRSPPEVGMIRMPVAVTVVWECKRCRREYAFWHLFGTDTNMEYRLTQLGIKVIQSYVRHHKDVCVYNTLYYASSTDYSSIMITSPIRFITNVC